MKIIYTHSVLSVSSEPDISFNLVHVDVRNPFSVSVFEDHVYWSSQEKGEVFRQDKFGRGDKISLLTAGPWLTQVSVYQQQRYNSLGGKLFAHPQHILCLH